MQHLTEEQRLLVEWTKEQPISVYQLDLADRVVLKIADERDAIQKKTFTKWVNKHLKKHWRFIQSGRTVHDLFEDLQDGHNLLSLLEVLSGELLARERGRMRFHKVQNCNAALHFLKYRKIKVVNIRPEDIVDGNPKLTLGLIWTIILHFQISARMASNTDQIEQQHQEVNAREARNALLVWVRDNVKGYPGVACKDFSRSWRDGLAFCALLHRHRPHLIDFRAARQRTNRENLEIAFGIAEKEFGVTRLLDAEDVDTPEPDDKSIITYVSSLYDALGNSQPQLEQVREARMNAYVDQAVSLHTWMTLTISRLHGKYQSSGERETQSLLAECALYRSEELPRKLDLKNQLSELYYELENLYINVPAIPVKEDIQPATLDKLWRMLLVAIEQREKSLHDDLQRCEKLRPRAEATCRSVLIIDGHLKNLKDQMKQDEQKIRMLKNPYEAKSICDIYDTELRQIDVSIKSTMTDVKMLREARYYDHENIYRSVLEVERKYVSVRTMYHDGIIAQIAGKTFTSEEKFVTKRTEKISSTRLLDHREKVEDGSGQSDEMASQSTEGSFYFSTPNSHAKLGDFHANGAGPVVQIQSYVDRENGAIHTSMRANGKDASVSKSDQSRNSNSSLTHGRSPHGSVDDPMNSDRKRSKVLMSHDVGLEDPNKRLLSNELNADGSIQSGKKESYYFGSGQNHPANGDEYSSRQDALLQGRRPSKELGRLQTELSVAGGDQSDRRTGMGNGSVDGVNNKRDVPMRQQHSGMATQTNGHSTVDAQVQYVQPKVNGQVVDQSAVLKKARADSLKDKANQVLTQLELFIGGLNGLENRCTDTVEWISQTRVRLQNKPLIFSTVASVQQALNDQSQMQRMISIKSIEVTSLRKEIEEAKLTSKGLTALLNEHRVHMTGNPPPIYAKSNELTSLITQISVNFDQLCSDATASQQNLQCLIDLLAAYQAHLDEASQWIGQHERQVFEAESLPNDKAGVELAKLRFEELGRQTGQFQNQMDRLTAIHGDVQMRTGNQAEQVKESHQLVIERWKGLREACNNRMRNLDSVSFFLQSCEQLLAWLMHKHKMISVLGPISFDLALLEHQKQQVDVLLEELRAQRNQINKLHDESGQLLSQTKEAERSSLIVKLSHLEDLWTELVHSLEARRRQIENAAFASQVFLDSLQTLDVWLDRLASSYEKFVQVDDLFNAERQLKELKDIENELNSQTYLLANAENAAATLCEVLLNDVTASEIESKLQNAKKKYNELKKRNETLKNGLEKNVKEGKEFDLSCDEMTKWFQSINDRIKPNVKVSALLDVLAHQLEAFEDVRGEVSRKEWEMHALTVHGKELVTKAPADIASSIQERLESMQLEWQDLNKRSHDRNSVLQQSLDQARRYRVAVDVFLPWLQKSEGSVAAFTPISFRMEENSAQLALVQELRNDVRLHSSDFDAVQQQGNVLVTCCEADTEGVLTEMADIQTRWDALDQVTLKRVRSLEDVSHRLTEYEDAMTSFQTGLAKCEEKLMAADEAEPDQKTMENLIVLQDEVESMKRQIDYIEDFGHGLLADGAQSDVRHIEEELASARGRYDDLENKIGESITFLEGATTAVSQFVEYLKQTENCVNELEDELDNMGTEGKDVDTLLNQIDEVTRFERNIDATVKEVHDAESALSDLVENQYAANNAEGWKDQIEGMFEQLENLALRAQNRASDLDVAREKLEEFHNTLANVMHSLAQDGEEGLEIAPDGRTNYIHEQFFQRLDGMLVALNNTADKLANCEPISALPGKLQKQMEENTRLIEDLGKRSHTYESAKRAATDLAKLANNEEEEATVGSIQGKLSSLDHMWIAILKDTEDRGRSLEDTYKISVKFWEELGNVTDLIKELETALLNQEPPAVEIPLIKSQQDALQELKEDLNQSQPDFTQCITTGQELIDLCGEPDKPEVKKSIEELDHVWGNITQLFLQRDTDLLDAMEKSMSFHGLLQSLTQFLEEAEDAFAKMGTIGAETDTVKEQMEQLKEFRTEMEPHTVDVESLMTQADELIMRTSLEQAEIVSVPVLEIEQRWESLWAGVNERQYELENALVRLGQFRHALAELVSWIVDKDAGLDSWTIPFGDSKTIELEMAKHKVLLNDLAANQNSVDILNEAGHAIIEASEGGEDARATQILLEDLEQKWEELLQKAELKQTLLEERLKEAESFQDEIQDKLNWLNEKDQHLIASKPVGGLPQSAKDQLNNFMDLFSEIESNKAVIDSIIKRGQEYLETAPEGMSAGLDHSLKTLKHRWDAALTKANDRKIKLEIAVRDAVEFYDLLQAFTLWLTNAEKSLSTAKPPSRILDVIMEQIEEHKAFQEDLSQHLAAQNALDKKGTTLKYFSQKQDVVQIKNLLASVQQRWDKLISASADRQRSLTSAHMEGKEFNRHYAEMSEWLDLAENSLDGSVGVPSDADKIRAQLVKHKEFQKQLTTKQGALNGISKMGRMLKESAPKSEQAVIQTMLTDLQKKWKTVGTKSAERQRKLEEALLFTGQFKEALYSMLEWLSKIEPLLSETAFVHGDIDNVRTLDEQHKALENDLSNRSANISIVRKAAKELTASGEEDSSTATQLAELEEKWTAVQDLAEKRRTKLNDALRGAMEFHQVLHSLIEWLGATEMKIRVFKALPEDVNDVKMAIFEIHEYQSEMQARQASLETALALGNTIQTKCHPDSVATMRHWLKVLNTRWQEVDVLMKQREQRLKDHMSNLEKSGEELDGLLVWFFSVEANLISVEQQDLPHDLEGTKRLLNEHQELEGELYSKQMAVERLTQPRPHSNDSLQLMDKKGPRKSNFANARRPGEPAFHSDNARDLYYRNRDVTARAVYRRNQLQDHFSHMLELEKLKGFQFEDWRRKFVRFMNVKKLRVMDFFRRYDTDRDGRLTREEFIKCILDEKFQTTELELEIVADVFDQNGDGLIDYQEFLHALKPDWKSTQNLTEADKIEDELTFQTRNCTCEHPHHYELQRKKDSQGAVQSYIFSENQQLRLVRILHTTIMVRVGGGWETLDKFLVKNDPCRIKGRTNVELRETFILPDGSSQAMTPFKNKKPSGIFKQADPSDPRLSSVGPISKIRVKTVNTTPWKTGAKNHETSSDPGGAAGGSRDHHHQQHAQIPHSHTHNHLLGGGLTINTNAKVRPSLSKPSSRPPSRAASEAPEEQPSHSSHSTHSRSSSISSMSSPSVVSTKTPSALSKTTHGTNASTNGKSTTTKVTSNPRKR